jgi:hypothetical protein
MHDAPPIPPPFPADPGQGSHYWSRRQRKGSMGARTAVQSVPPGSRPRAGCGRSDYRRSTRVAGVEMAGRFSESASSPRRLAVRSNRRRRSNDHCEQFDQYDSNHQHRDCHRIVIEPMPLLYRMRDTPPCSSNSTTYAHMCRTASLRGLCYFCVSSCSRSAAICAETGVARASYWTLRQCPSDSQTLRSPKAARFRGDRFTRDWSAGCDADCD